MMTRNNVVVGSKEPFICQMLYQYKQNCLRKRWINTCVWITTEEEALKNEPANEALEQRRSGEAVELRRLSESVERQPTRAVSEHQPFITALKDGRASESSELRPTDEAVERPPSEVSKPRPVISWGLGTTN